MSAWDFLVWFIAMYLFFVCIALFVRVLVDAIRDPEMSGGQKVLWVLFVLVVPLIGAIVYIAVRGFHARKVQAASHEEYLRESERIAAGEQP